MNLICLWCLWGQNILLQNSTNKNNKDRYRLILNMTLPIHEDVLNRYSWKILPFKFDQNKTFYGHLTIICRFITHWGRITHICFGKLTTVVSDNGLLPGRQAIIWTSAGILLIGSLWTTFSEMLIGIQAFSSKKTHLKMSSATFHPFCLGLNSANALLPFHITPVSLPLAMLSSTEFLNTESLPSLRPSVNIFRNTRGDLGTQEGIML